jgi:PucR family transcriptional regulator, purine catabolism regulatory protein
VGYGSEYDKHGAHDRSKSRKEARWALEASADRSVTRVHYQDAIPEVGPRTPEEADAYIRWVLLGTLSSFLHHERSWQRTADAMHLHRQTVLYRMRKVEQLLDLRVSDTGDLATLWIAVRAWERQGH